MKRSGRIGLVAVAAIAMLAFSTSAYAFGSYLDDPGVNDFHSVYPAAVGSRIDNCTLCHVSGGYSRNPYGTAFAGAGHSFAAIASADSDGDTYGTASRSPASSSPATPRTTPPRRPTLRPRSSRSSASPRPPPR